MKLLPFHVSLEPAFKRIIDATGAPTWCSSLVVAHGTKLLIAFGFLTPDAFLNQLLTVLAASCFVLKLQLDAHKAKYSCLGR